MPTHPRFVLPVAVLAVALACGSGCTVAIRGGIQLGGEDVEGLVRDAPVSVWELESEIYRFADDKVDLQLGLDLVSVGNDTDFLDLRATSRFYPRPSARLSPYVGGGIGWYRWSIAEEVRIPDEFCSVLGQNLIDCVTNDEVSLADGWFPFASAGLDFEVGQGIDWTVEARHDLAKEDGAFDFGATQILTGFRFRINAR